MLDFVREMLLGNEPLSPRQAETWIEALERYSPRMIQTAFHQWVRTSKHMPVPAEIIEILDGLVEAERAEQTAVETSEYLDELRHTRERLAAEGLLHGDAQLHAILKEANERIKSIPPFPDPNRRVELRERLARALAEKQKAA